jgi:hypothetical protein
VLRGMLASWALRKELTGVRIDDGNIFQRREELLPAGPRVRSRRSHRIQSGSVPLLLTHKGLTSMVVLSVAYATLWRRFFGEQLVIHVRTPVSVQPWNVRQKM